MTKATIIVTDKNFRVTIPEEIRIAEGIRQGDIIEVDIKAIRKQEDWDCKDYIFTEEESNFVKINSERGERNAIIKLSPAATDQRINVFGIKLLLKDADNNEISDDIIIMLCKKEKYKGNSELVGKYEYGDLKRKVTLKSKISLSFYEELGVYADKNIRSEKIRFYADLCVRKQ